VAVFSLNIHTALLILLEAAIGIEPMNKGFAVLAKLFAQVQPCLLVSIFIRVSDISSLPVIA
jgi:hypothetical protein